MWSGIIRTHVGVIFRVLYIALAAREPGLIQLAQCINQFARVLWASGYRLYS